MRTEGNVSSSAKPNALMAVVVLTRFVVHVLYFHELLSSHLFHIQARATKNYGDIMQQKRILSSC